VDKTSAALAAALTGTAALLATIGYRTTWLAVTLVVALIIEATALAIAWRHRP
jgi:hypothetical protein